MCGKGQIPWNKGKSGKELDVDLTRTEKVCTKCKKLKKLSEYAKIKNKRQKEASRCKTCAKIAHDKWMEINRDKHNAYVREKYKINKKPITEKRKEYQREYHKKYKWNPGNRRKYYKKRYDNDILYRISVLLRTRLNNAIKKNIKNCSPIRNLGCTLQEFKIHIEKKFIDGMSWENRKEWHIDHIIPLASFDLTKEEEVLKACHYTNMQPLWAKDNMMKGAKILK